ncbi:hypothetical protein V1224_13045 [Lachnospiraceae bacterium JLR.KK008]
MEKSNRVQAALIINIFGTAVLMPWSEFEHFYVLLDDLFYEKTGSELIFHQIRSQVSHKKGQTLHDIYSYIHEFYNIKRDVCDLLEKQEYSFLRKYLIPRNYTQKIYEEMLCQDVQIIFCTDILNDKKMLTEILNECGYFGEHMTCSVEEVRDIVVSNRYKTITYLGDSNLFIDSKVIFRWIPDTLNCLTGTVDKRMKGLHSFYTAAGNMLHCEKIRNSAGFDMMQQMIANKFFDDPFPVWKENSEFNADPYYLGYYVLGMHLMGVVKWLAAETRRNNNKRILFCARDGYLIMRAYEKYRSIFSQLPEAAYIQASRKALLPAILKKKEDFYFIPDLVGGASCCQYSPEIIMLLLWDFTGLSENYYFGDVPQQVREAYISEIRKAGFIFEQSFQSYEHFAQFIKIFINLYYDEEKHMRMYQATKHYYEEFTGKDVLFDSGYSGKLPKIVTELSSGMRDVLYLYTNEDTAECLVRRGGFEIRSFYPYTPCEEAMIREFLIAENGPTCRMFLEENGKIEPIFEKADKKNGCGDSVAVIHKGALDFVDDFLDQFGPSIKGIPYKPYEVSLPFEGFIRHILPADREMFASTYQEDYYTGKAMGFPWIELYERTIEKFPRVKNPWMEE